MIDYLDSSFYEVAFSEPATEGELQNNALRLCSAYVELSKRFAESLNRVHFDRAYWDREVRVSIMQSISSAVIPSAKVLAQDDPDVLLSIVNKMTTDVYSHLREVAGAIDIYTELTAHDGSVYRIQEHMGRAPIMKFVSNEETDTPDKSFDEIGLFQFLEAHETVRIVRFDEPGIKIIRE